MDRALCNTLVLLVVGAAVSAHLFPCAFPAFGTGLIMPCRGHRSPAAQLCCVRVSGGHSHRVAPAPW